MPAYDVVAETAPRPDTNVVVDTELGAAAAEAEGFAMSAEAEARQCWAAAEELVAQMQSLNAESPDNHRERILVMVEVAAAADLLTFQVVDEQAFECSHEQADLSDTGVVAHAVRLDVMETS